MGVRKYNAAAAACSRRWAPRPSSRRMQQALGSSTEQPPHAAGAGLLEQLPRMSHETNENFSLRELCGLQRLGNHAGVIFSTEIRY